MNKSNVFLSLILSIIIQLLTIFIQLFSLFIKIPIEFFLLKQLLILDFIVQIIEGIFYLTWLYNFKNVTNITPKRYMDWVLTTPTMLITLIFYLIFLGFREKNISSYHLEFFDIFYQNFTSISYILLLNWLMLLFGYLSEINLIPTLLGVSLGFIPFFIYYYIIYTKYAILSNNGFKIYLYFLFFWSLYGIAAIFPYDIKNSFYNILDLFSKNFFGVFLVYIIFTNNY
jgi:bacteriorhodopsin